MEEELAIEGADEDVEPAPEEQETEERDTEEPVEEESPAEEALTDAEPAEEIEDDEAPVTVERKFPRLASGWAELSSKQRDDIMADVAGELDQGGGAPEDTEDSEKEVAPSSQKGKPEPPASPRFAEQPDDVADVDLKAMAEELGEDSAVYTAMQKLVAKVTFAANAATDIGKATVEAIDDMRDGQGFQEAVEIHARDLRKLAAADRAKVLGVAREYKRSKRTKDWEAAIGLAVYHSRSGGTPEDAERKVKARQIAGSLTTRKRGSQKTRRPPEGASVMEIAEHYGVL